MELAAAREICERVWLEIKYMIGSEVEDAERYKRFMEENPIIMTGRYPTFLRLLFFL